MAKEPTTQDEELAASLMREFSVASNKRGIWEKHWETIAQQVLPYYSTTFYSQSQPVPGQQRGQEQYDATANGALWKFSAAMESMLTPANSRWHKIRATDPALMKIRNVALWCDQVSDILFHYRYSPHSGYQAQQHEGYVSIGAFGTSCLFIDEYIDRARPEVKGLRYRNIHLGDLFFATNFQGQVDKVYRRFKMTLRQVVQKWGKDSLPYDYEQRFEKAPDDEVFMLHIIKPNNEYEPQKIDKKGKRFVSYYLLKDTGTLMSTGGYRVFPYAIARYITAPGELYGRSPAMNVLPAIMTVNEEKRVLLKQGHRAIDPIYLAHDDGVLEYFNAAPGTVVPGGISAEGRPLIGTLPVGNIAIGKELMDDERAAINDGFLVTLFQILVDAPQMTATEVLERARERGALLSPTMGRFQTESLGPMIEREIDILGWLGLLPPMPQELDAGGGRCKVEYDAPLNRAMRSDEAAGGMRTVQWLTEIAQVKQDPTVLNVINFDAMNPELCRINGMPERWIQDPQVMAQMASDAQQQQQQQQMVQALPGVAQLTKAIAPQGSSPNPGQPSGP